MNRKIIILAVLLILLSSYAFALQKSYLWVTLGYGRGWWGWACVTEKGMSGVHGYPIDFCGARECPFEAALVLGENNCIKKDVNDPSLYEDYVMNKGAAMTGAYGALTRITVPEDFKLVKSDGTVVTDELCVGDKIALQKGVMKGEYWDDGGNIDTPSIYWVDDVEALAKKIMQYHDNTELTCKDVSSEKPADGFVDDLTGIAVYEQTKSSIVGRMVCSLKEKGSTSAGFKKNGNTYEVTGVGNADFKASYSVVCMYYQYGSPGGCVGGVQGKSGGVQPEQSTDVKGLSGGFAKVRLPMVIQVQPLPPGGGKATMYENMHPGIKETVIDYPPGFEEAPLGNPYIHNVIFNSMEDFFKIGDINVSKTFKVVSPESAKVELSVKGGDSLRMGEPNDLRVVVKNTGSAGITIKKVFASTDYRFISCDFVDVKAGAQSECLITVTPAASKGLMVIVDYEYKSCGKTKTGTVSKVLFGSVIVDPTASAQVYGIDVLGDCRNSYYQCSSPDSEKMFFAGFLCHNTDNKYYTPSKSRFDLRFSLPDVSSGVVTGAQLNLYVSAVNKAQDVVLYSVGESWVPVSCTPGGDICTRPYCPECAPLFDLQGASQVSSASVGASGIVSLDVSDLVKQAYARGDSYVNLQVRGAEDAWTCDKVNDWTKQDVEFYGLGGMGPKLKIDYSSSN